LTTNHLVRDLVIRNTGDATAENLRFQPMLLGQGNHLHIDGMRDDGWSEPMDLPGESSIAYSCFPLQGRANVRITIRWDEDGHSHERNWTIQVT
jgi:hypothetical protein